MRISTIALTTIAFGSVLSAAFTYFTDWNKPAYEPRKSITFEQAIGRYDYALEYAKLLKGDPKTGKINGKDIMAARRNIQRARAAKADPMGLVFYGLGPDNVGGRTRAIAVDKDNPNIIMAGGVSGGVYVSYDGAQSWYPKIGGTNHLIGAIAQAANGNFWIGTGPGHDDYGGGGSASSNSSDNVFGDGLYRVKTIDAEYEHIISVEDDGPEWSRINKIATHPTNADIILVATSGNGLQVSKNASSADPTFTQASGIQGASIGDVDISPDGNTVLVTTNGRVWRSTDGGDNFTLSLNNEGSSRIECDIARSDGNYAYISAVDGNGCLHTIQQSTDGGVTWHVIAAGDGSGNTATFDPFANYGINCQGRYDNAIAVFPDNPGRILVGGVQLWEGNQQPGSSPPAFGWSQVAITNGGPITSAGIYVHADKHTFNIPDRNTIYIGSDGGIGKSTTSGGIWTQNNKGYRTTQFYSMAILPITGSLDDIVMGGTQDNGTLVIGLASFIGGGFLNSPTEAFELQGGDGFDCEMSTVGNVTFSTSQFGRLRRLDGTGGGSTFWDEELESLCGNDCGPFYSCIEYWDTPYSAVTFDSVLVHVNVDVNAGDTISYASPTGSYPILDAVPVSLKAGDSLLMPDRVQTKLAFANVDGPSIYLTRDGVNLTVTVPEWSKIAGPESYPSPFSGHTFTMQYSADGNHLFVGTLSGAVFRISNLLYAHDSLTSDIRSSSCVLTCTQIGSVSSVVTGIAADPNNIDRLVITAGGYNNPTAVYRVTGATTNPDFEVIQGDLPVIPVFEAEIDVSNHNVVLIGTEYGVWATSNAFSASTGSQVEWTDENVGIPRVPVYEIKQQTRPFGVDIFAQNIGISTNYKTYYAATHGAGFFKTESLVGIEDIKGEKEAFTTNLTLYPNPVRANSYIEFDLPAKTNTRVIVYNLKGQIVDEMNLGNLPAGKQKIKLATASLSAGTYILALRAGAYSDVTKFIKSE